MSGQENKKNKIIIISLLAIICVLVIILLVLVAKQNGYKNSENVENTDTASQELMAENTIPTATEVIEYYEIETPYVMLHYPVKWQNNVRTEVENGDVYRVKFYGHIEGREEQPLFTLGFGDTAGVTIGKLTTSDGLVLNVTIESYEASFGEDWTQNEKNNIYIMMEDVNFIIQELVKVETFELSE